jgi:hypothetical protein
MQRLIGRVAVTRAVFVQPLFSRAHRFHRFAGNSIVAKPLDAVWPVVELIEVALLQCFQLIELVSRITSGVALYPGSGYEIRPAEKLLAILIDQFEIEVLGHGQSPGLGGLDLASRGGLWVRGLTCASGRQNHRHQE